MVYILLADGFEEIEAVYPTDFLRRCGVEINTVGVAGAYVTGSHDIVIKSDIVIDDVDSDNVKMLILPGGPGRVNITKSEKATSLIRKCYDNSVPIAAICGAPEVLASLGCLDGKTVTCFPGLEKNLTGAVHSDELVVTDGNLITSQAAGTSDLFSYAIASFLCGSDKANEVFEQMKCHR